MIGGSGDLSDRIAYVALTPAPEESGIKSTIQMHLSDRTGPGVHTRVFCSTSRSYNLLERRYVVLYENTDIYRSLHGLCSFSFPIQESLSHQELTRDSFFRRHYGVSCVAFFVPVDWQSPSLTSAPEEHRD